jgi:hypothetical protein
VEPVGIALERTVPESESVRVRKISRKPVEETQKEEATSVFRREIGVVGSTSRVTGG